MSQKSGILSQDTLNLLFAEISDSIKSQQVQMVDDREYNKQNSVECEIYQIRNNYNSGSDQPFDAIDLGDGTIVTLNQNQQFQQYTQPSVFQLIKSSSLPSNVIFNGDYDFHIEFSTDTNENKSISWTYSEELNKIYSKLAVACPLKVKVGCLPPNGTIIRLVAVYKKDEHKNEVIKRCANHTDSKEHNENHPATSHFIRVENSKCYYENDKCKSTIVPYESPQIKSPYTVYLVQFMCYNSCIGGGKKPIEIIVTLENNDIVLGRQKFDIKICACPYRDKEAEEKNFSKKEIKNSKNTNKGVNKKSLKKDESKVLKNEIESNITQNKINREEITPVINNKIITVPTTSTTTITPTSSQNEVFMLQVVGRKNYETLIYLRDALYAKDTLIENQNQDKNEKNNEAININNNDNDISNSKKNLRKDEPTFIYGTGLDNLNENNSKSLFKIETNNAPSFLSRNESVEMFLSGINLDYYFDSFKSAGINTIADILECQENDIDQLNISEAHTKQILEGISNLKATFEDTTPSQQSSSLSTKKQQQLQLNKSQNSFEITKVSIKYPIQTNQYDKNQQILPTPNNYMMTTRKRSQLKQDNNQQTTKRSRR